MRPNRKLKLANDADERRKKFGVAVLAAIGALAALANSGMDRVGMLVDKARDQIEGLMQRAADQAVIEENLIITVEELRDKLLKIVQGGAQDSFDGAGDAVDTALVAAGLAGVAAAVTSGYAKTNLDNWIHDLIFRMTEDYRSSIDHVIGALRAGTINVNDAIAGLNQITGATAARGQTIALTEIGRARSLGVSSRVADTKDDLESQGFYLAKTWATMEDERVRESHVDAGLDYAEDGDPGPILPDEEFIVGGEACQYPRDISLSPEESCNCRCDAIPVLLPVPQANGETA